MNPSLIRALVTRFPAVVPHLGDAAKAMLKAAESLADIRANYHDGITQALLDYFVGGGNITGPRNAYGQAMITAFNYAFDAGWQDGGAAFPIDDDAAAWLDGRIEQERTFIETVFADAKEIRKDPEADYFAWITARVDGYVNTLDSVYNQAVMLASKDKMVEFGGDDGAESCPTCQKLKGKRHRISWWVAHDLIPGVPGNTNYECNGYRCEHYLFDPKTGERVTI